MSYLSRFEADLFVSYGHLDNSAATADEQRWIDRFHRDLELRVAQYLGSTVTIWRDNYLGGNTDFPEEIKLKLQSTAVLIPIISPRYLKSDWCQRELQAFLRAVERNGGIKIGTKSRLFKVVKTLVDVKEQPDVMQSVLGYEFYVLDENGRPKELPDWDPLPDAEKRYLARLDDLAYDLHLLLKEMKASPPDSPVSSVRTPEILKPQEDKNGAGRAPAAPGEGICVYLAETTKELADNRDEIRRELLAFGYEVLPDEPLPDESTDLTQKVTAWLNRCRLSLHLIGARYGLVPEGEEIRSRLWLQQELAAERKAYGNFDSILWIPPGTDVTDGRQKAFLQHLQEELKTENKFELLKTPLQDLKNYVFDKLKPRVEPPRTTSRISPGAHIYLICDQRDFEAIKPIRDYLNKRKIGVDLPLWEGAQTDMRLDHEATLQDCDGVLIYYGAASEAWLREKIRDLRRARGLGRTRPFTPQGIYLGPEATEAKNVYSNREFIVIRNFEAFSPECLKAFVEGATNTKQAFA